MNENQYQNQETTKSSASSDAGMTSQALSVSSTSCCQKMMAACKDTFRRFMSARVGISYDITTRMMGEGQGSDSGSSAGEQGQSGKTRGQSSANTMTKQGELELRMTDLTIGALMLCAVMSMMCAVKGMCCGKGCGKSKC